MTSRSCSCLTRRSVIPGHVTHAAREGVHVLRYFGAVNYTLAPGLQRFLQHLIHAGSVSGLVFDLTQAESLDSTNLGLMGRVNEEVHGLGAANSVIIFRNDDIDAVLRSMGFDQTFDLFPAGQAMPNVTMKRSRSALHASPSCSTRC